jgi:glycosyltransferase involved in cell wall biosynthesis
LLDSCYDPLESKGVYKINDITVCMVSSMPPEGGGVSTYTQSLIDSFDLSNMRITVLSQVTENKDTHELKPPANRKIKVIPCWSSSLLYPFQLFKALCRHKPNLVHVQHEYFIFGGAFSASLFPIFLMLTKLLNTRVIVTLHGIVNPAEIRDPELGSVGDENLKGMPRLLSHIGLLLITRLITKNSDKIIVMNNTHKRVLIQEYHCSPEKIMLIPHGIPQCQPIPLDTAKETLGFNGSKVILYFGYMTKYKGIDILIKAFERVKHPNSLLILGGGPHPRLKNDPEYKKFWNSINSEAIQDNRIKFVGFIPNELLPTYISAADLVVFPYVASFSTGGPMNITLGYHKPIVASRMSSFSDSLPNSAIFKTGSVNDLCIILEKALDNEQFTLDLVQWTKDLADNRSWACIAKSTIDLYHHIKTH